MGFFDIASELGRQVVLGQKRKLRASARQGISGLTSNLPCPTCHAAPGKPCRTRSGRTTTQHAKRSLI